MWDEHQQSRNAEWPVCDLGEIYSYTLLVVEEQEEASCKSLHHVWSVALARAVDAHDVMTGGTVAVKRL